MRLALPATGRDLRFDSLRGLMLLFMTVNHLPSVFRRVTDSSLGLFSAAEGFVFLSGLLAGWVYTRKYREKGPDFIRAASSFRATQIYRWHLASFFAAFALVWLLVVFTGFCSLTSPVMFYSDPLLALGLGSLLLFQPGLLDILPMYCAFVLLVPCVLSALEKGRRAWVLGISGLSWAITQFAPPLDAHPLPPINLGTFNLFAWQFLFVLGLTFGHARSDPKAKLIPRQSWVTGLAFLIVVHGLALRYFYDVWPLVLPEWILGLSLNKPALGFFRLLDFLAVAYFIALTAARFPRWFSWRPLAFLGRHSLAVVATQSVIVMGLLQFPDLFRSFWLNFAVSTAVILLLYVAAAINQWFKARKPTRQTPLSPTTRPPGNPCGHVVHAIAAANPVHPRG